MQNLLIVIDMQNDFIDGTLGTKEAQGIVNKVVDKINARKSEGWEILYTRDTHTSDYLSTSEGQRLPVPHCIQGTHGHEIAAAVPIYGHVLDKPSFGSPELAALVASKQPQAVELIGLCTDICVISNAILLRAFLPECPISVQAACCAGVTPQSHHNALEAMKLCHIDIT